jgi:hypothetical protein
VKVFPPVAALQETVALPEPVIVAGVIAPQVKPAGTESVRTTTPVKPFTAETVIVEDAEIPALTAAGDVATMLYSAPIVKLNVAVTV